MFETQFDCQLVQVLMFVVVLVSLSLLLNMIWFDTRLWKTFLCDCLWNVMSMMEYCFSHLESIWPVPTYSIKGWTGLNMYRYLGNMWRTFTNKMWPVVQFYFSKVSSPVLFQLQSGYQVLPPRRRWDFCQWELRALGRNDPNLRVIGTVPWRCCAQKFLWGLWHIFAMTVGSGRSNLGSENRKELKRFR